MDAYSRGYSDALEKIGIALPMAARAANKNRDRAGTGGSWGAGKQLSNALNSGASHFKGLFKKGPSGGANWTPSFVGGGSPKIQVPHMS